MIARHDDHEVIAQVGMTAEEMIVMLIESPAEHGQYVAYMLTHADGSTSVELTWCNSSHGNDVGE